MRWNPAKLALAMVALSALGCEDRSLPVGLRLEGHKVTSPDPGGMPAAGGAGGVGAGGGGGAAGGPATVDPACPVQAAAMPVRPLTLPGAEVAKRLAWLLRRAEPDAELLMNAQGLATTADVGQLAAGMLSAPGSAPGLRALTQAWLQVEPVPVMDPALKQSMIEETQRFVQDLIVAGDGSLGTLLSATNTFADARLGAIYGVPGLPDTLVKTPLDPMQRSGVLTHASILSARPHATTRGIWLRNAFLCQQIPAPPENMPSPPPMARRPGTTYRQALTETVSQAVCMGCHQLTDPIGFSLENFEETGRWRTTDEGLPVDASGELHNVRGLATTSVVGARDLGSKLAMSCDVHICVARKFLAHALGRDLVPADEGWDNEVISAFAQSGFNLRDLLAAVVQSPAFLAP